VTTAAVIPTVTIAIPGYDHFEDVLENFMLIIALSEHIIYKRGFWGYHLKHYLGRRKLPPGIAAMTAFCFGIAGAILGMLQVWFEGPIGALCGAPFGGDIGLELAFSFSALSYIILRYFEKKHFGR